MTPEPPQTIYSLYIEIWVEPDGSEPVEMVSSGYDYKVEDCSGAEGAFVEIENTGDVCRLPAGVQIWRRGTGYEYVQKPSQPTWGWSASGLPPNTSRFFIPHTEEKRPIVLLADGGGSNQVFSHWEGLGDTPTPQGGARSELPEPEVSSDDQSVRAVFKKKPEEKELADKRMGRFQPGEETLKRSGPAIPRP